MKDDWSLKDNCWGGCEYHASDIETLRQKLIEDLIKAYANKVANPKIDFTELICDIVNQRFGVENK